METQAARIIRKLYSMDTIQAEWVRKTHETDYLVARLTKAGLVQPTCTVGIEALNRVEKIIDTLIARKKGGA